MSSASNGSSAGKGKNVRRNQGPETGQGATASPAGGSGASRFAQILGNTPVESDAIGGVSAGVPGVGGTAGDQTGIQFGTGGSVEAGGLSSPPVGGGQGQGRSEEAHGAMFYGDRGAAGIRDAVAAPGVQDLRAQFEVARSEAPVDAVLVVQTGPLGKRLAELGSRPLKGSFVKEGDYDKEITDRVLQNFWSIDVDSLTVQQRCEDDWHKADAEWKFNMWCYFHGSNKAESGEGGGGALDTGGHITVAGGHKISGSVLASLFRGSYSIHRYTRTKCVDIRDSVNYVITNSARGVRGFKEIEDLIRFRAVQVGLPATPQYAFVGGERIPDLPDGLRRKIYMAMKDFVESRAIQQARSEHASEYAD